MGCVNLMIIHIMIIHIAEQLNVGTPEGLVVVAR